MGRALVHIVDDDPNVRAILARLLVSGGYRVREYVSGLALLNASKSLDDGFILLDIDKVQPDGFAVKSALVDKMIDLPVIMMSGYDNLSSLAKQAGVTQFLQKPFGRDELLLALETSAIDRPCV